MTVTQRFLDYISYATTSDEASQTIPSTDSQKVLGKHLVEELNESYEAIRNMKEHIKEF